MPLSLDWRMKGVLSPVKHQKLCGSCYAFTAASAMEAFYNIHYADSYIDSYFGGEMDLSEQEIVDCAQGYPYYCSGCGGGSIMGALRYIFYNGLAQDAHYPYTGRT